LGEQSLDGGNWHMSLDHVTCYLGGMASSQRRRDAKPCSHGLQVSGLPDPHHKTGVAKVLYPKRTAAAIGVLMDDDHRVVG
jgi:hypothetical protein